MIIVLGSHSPEVRYAASARRLYPNSQRVNARYHGTREGENDDSADAALSPLVGNHFYADTSPLQVSTIADSITAGEYLTAFVQAEDLDPTAR